MASPNGNKITNGAAIAWADGSVISDKPSTAGNHMRVRSMLQKEPHLGGAMMEYGGMRDGLMTPDHGDNSR